VRVCAFSRARSLDVQNGPNSYHTAHGEDALLIANDYYHTTDAITYLGACAPSSLIVCGARVCVCATAALRHVS
jgi:hypothetical protein